jgi:hypothetical protein
MRVEIAADAAEQLYSTTAIAIQHNCYSYTAIQHNSSLYLTKPTFKNFKERAAEKNVFSSHFPDVSFGLRVIHQLTLQALVQFQTMVS